MTNEEKQARIELLEAQLAFMRQHENADTFTYNLDGALTQVLYLSPVKKAEHPELFSPEAWLKFHKKQQEEKTH